MTAKVLSSEPDKRDDDDYNNFLDWEALPSEVRAKPCWTPGEDAEHLNLQMQKLKSSSFQEDQIYTREQDA